MQDARLRLEYFPVEYRESLQLEEATPPVGHDLGSLPAGLDALRRARDSGEAAMTAALPMASGRALQVYWAVYRRDIPRQSVAERREALLGYVGAVLRLDAVGRGTPLAPASRRKRNELYLSAGRGLASQGQDRGERTKEACGDRKGADRSTSTVTPFSRLFYGRKRPAVRYSSRMESTDLTDSGGDPFDLARFTTAQRGVYERALAELRAGRKQSHWMWFIFPQFEGLGLSATSRYYAIRSLAEARQYLRHPLLGPRLVECSETLLAHAGVAADDLFPFPDDLKLKSCMTLFELADPAPSVFGKVLERFFDGERDAKTLELLRP